MSKMENDAKLALELESYLQAKPLSSLNSKNNDDQRVSQMSHNTDDDFKPMKLFNEDLQDLIGPILKKLNSKRSIANKIKEQLPKIVDAKYLAEHQKRIAQENL